MTNKEIAKYLVDHPGITNERARRNLHRHHVSSAEIQKARQLNPAGLTSATAQAPGKTIAAFRAEYDIHDKIKAGLAAISPAVYMTDTEFRELCKVHLNNWRRHADAEDFLPYRIKVNGLWFWAKPAMIQKMKHIVGQV